MSAKSQPGAMNSDRGVGSPTRSLGSLGGRKRKCTAEGAEYFGRIAGENRDRAQKKILSLIDKIEK